MKNKIITVSGLYCYPVKSCGGISLETAHVGKKGILFDRQWMVVNHDGMFVAQRGDKKLGAVGIKTMCLIKTSISHGSLVLEAPNMPMIFLPLSGFDGSTQKVQVWKDVCEGIDQGDEIAQWLSIYLSREVPGIYRMVRMPDYMERKTHKGNGSVAFADGYPFLMISEASLNDLNNRLADRLPMNRFRPNIVIKGCEPFWEDNIANFSIDEINFTSIKPCVRCPITATNQETAERGKEPLKTLATFRFQKQYGGVTFGMNLVHTGSGSISLGSRLIF